MTLKFDTSVAKRLKLKVRKFWGLNPTFVEVSGEKLVGGLFGTHFGTHILNRVKCSKTKAGFCYLQFLKIASDEKPLVSYTHWYHFPKDIIDPCVYFDIPGDYNIEETCGSYLNGESGSSWICFPLCNQWCNCLTKRVQLNIFEEQILLHWL